MMRVTILGSGTALPHPDRGPSGLLLEAGGKRLLVDCGPGVLRAAVDAEAGPGDIDGVLLTHIHLDHTADLRTLLFVLRNLGFAGRPPLSVTGPPGLRRLLDQWFAADDGEWMTPRGYELVVREIGEGDHEVGGLFVTPVPVEHTAASLAYRIRESRDGPVLAVSGDTTYCEGIIRAGREANLFILECALPDSGPEGIHLTPTTAGRVAAAANPERLVLTHFYPEVLSEPIEEIVRRHYGGEIRMAWDGATYEVD